MVTPGVPTTDDVVWWLRQRGQELGYTTWFQPSVSVQRQGGVAGDGPTVIQPGDLLWTDFGLVAMNLHTDTQHLGYVLKPGETGRMTLELSLRDKSLRAITPFRLTVRCDDGRVLLDAKQIDGEVYLVKDVEPAGYEFLLESDSGNEQVRFGWRIGQD